MQEFFKAAGKKRVKLIPINPLKTKLEIKKGRVNITYPEFKLKDLDSSIHGAHRRYYDFVLMLLEHMESCKIPLTASPLSVWRTRNKFATMQTLQRAGIPVPDSFLTYSQELALKGMNRMKQPVVLKLLESSSGKGIMKAKDFTDVEGLTGTLRALEQMIFIQEYIENGNEDIRAFVVGDEIIGAMKRKGKRGMWKANISLGGKGKKVILNEELSEIALKSAEVLGTKICGVDIIETKDGPKVIETNITPGFKGLLEYTGVNPAPKIIDLAKSIAKK